MVHESRNGFWRQEVQFVVVKGPEDVVSRLFGALFVRQLRQLHEEHKRIERQLLVLGVKHEERQEVILQCVPLAECLPDERNC